MSASPPPVPVPRYGAGALADLPPSVLAGLGVPGTQNVLGLPRLPRACVLIIDGLGWELLRAHPEDAPFLASLPGGPLTAGFPATTVASLGSLATGLPPGGHGLLGVQVAIPGAGRLLNCLRWKDPDIDPVTFQPAPTVYQKAAADGVNVSYVALGFYRNTGLSIATARGATYRPADDMGELVGRTQQALREGERSFVTVYHADLDATGHRYGSGSADWRFQLRFVDLLAERIASVLPSGTGLYITADHGMVDPTERVDFDTVAELQAGVAMLGGDARCRYVYAQDGAAGDVLAAWQELLGDRAWVYTREDAVAEGWFGPVEPDMLARIGDVIAVPYADMAIVASRLEPLASLMTGMHGSLVPAEQLVPLLRVTRE
ncbi:alkaline phosphatase family protein [Actinomadura rudentiformis]|uniref:Alkaline phosphatase family protein n=1 Tax=Actinomadura rudentiformis TaxID=359158 RepID=A0A6H9YRG2_9ACTN|nr:nucleotide pyrophosphatase/phosphodiesterase family protein [Actinomadura rudentiformis]KAB2346489.1 alkaline phosphatase family protein [Actinomadura rudentiformis]